jgi:hypothetical protein
MSRAFVRGVWGNFSGGDINSPRPAKMLKDVLSESKENVKYPIDFITYVMGKDNETYLKDLGFKTKLICNNSTIWDMKTELYRHKLEIINEASKDYDEIVYLDWDCKLIKPYDDKIWDILNNGEVCQANLFLYRTKKCLWRTEDIRKTCNGGFIYVRGKNISNKFIENWNGFKKEINKRVLENKSIRFREFSLLFDDEPAISKYIDDYCGGWKGVDIYWEQFEPKVCVLRRKSAFSKELNGTKDIYFEHQL